MSVTVGSYLDTVKDNLRLDPAEQNEIICELETHIEDSLHELKESGLSDEEATQTCLTFLGSARKVACEIYEAHSQGTWQQALLAAMPHLLYGALFALNWWQHSFWFTATLVLVTSVAFIGLLRGRPAWVFPWFGYSLLPVILIGALCTYLPRGLLWVAIPLYILIATWWLATFAIQAIKRDWLLFSLMLLPIPIAAGWLFAIAPDLRFTDSTLEQIRFFTPFISLNFVALAFIIVAFLRMRQRWLRTATLVISGTVMLIMVNYYAQGRLSLIALCLLLCALGGLILIPALLERRIRHSLERSNNSLNYNLNLHPDK